MTTGGEMIDPKEYEPIDPAAAVWYWGENLLDYSIYREKTLMATVKIERLAGRPAVQHRMMKTITAALNAEEQQS
jgi:hypothetical protein